MQNLNQQLQETKIFNPDSEDFTCTYDINGNSEPVSFTAPSMEISLFPTPVANHIKEHLSKHLAFKRGWQGSNFEDTKKQIEKEIEVNLDE